MNAFALLLLLVGARDQDAYDQAMAQLEESRYADAWQALESESDPVRQSRGRATVYLRAGDFAGELEAAEEGLTHAPENLELLYFAAQASLWLRDDERADAYLDRLARALERNPPADEGQREAWRSSVAGFRGSVEALKKERLTREGAVARARLVSLVALGGSLAALAFLAVRAGPGAPSGTPAP